MPKQIITHALAALLGAVVLLAALMTWFKGDRSVTFKMQGQQGCRVRVAYGPGDVPDDHRQHADALLPWEATQTMHGGEIARVEVQSGEACQPSCEIRVDGSTALSSSASTCAIVVGRFW